MAADAGYEVLVAVIAALKANSAVTAFTTAGRIYETYPEDTTAVSPYITIGPSDEQRTDLQCYYAKEVHIQVDAWSWGSGEQYTSAEVRKIAGAIEDAVHMQPLSLSTNRLVSIEHKSTQVMKDSDGTTNHAVVQFVAYVETPS